MSGPRLGEAVRAYLENNPARFHMPGHKGMGSLLPGEPARVDLTEVPGLDSLYHADGPIRETERAYARLYGSVDSLLSAGGATLCIQAMLALAPGPGGTLLCARGVHTAAVHAMALLDQEPVWMMPEGDPDSGLAKPLSPESIARALEAHRSAGAVYLTSPDYFGGMADLPAIAEICRRAGAPLLVDNAHGAHLRFVPGCAHPMEAGADLCCDSLHKTLPVLTGGAMLHVGNPRFGARARGMLALFGSTSPSYPIMLSADGAVDFLEGEGPEAIRACCRRLEKVRDLAKETGFQLPATAADPMRLVLGGGPLGLDGEGLATHLRAHGVEPELAGGRFCVLMASPGNGETDYRRLERALEAVEPGEPLPPPPPLSACAPRRVMRLREALFASARSLPLEECAGRVAGRFLAPCPPGVAVVAPGERLDAETLETAKNCGIARLDVVE